MRRIRVAVLLGALSLCRAQDAQLQEMLRTHLNTLESSPKSLAANNGAGMVLDLMGRYAEARKYFTAAIKLSSTDAAKAQARRALAISYGFEGDCRGAEKADRGAYDFYLASGDFYNAGEVADEIGRLCLDAGDLDAASEWYRRGHEAGLAPENPGPVQSDLWNFRWAHARARIAARRGKHDEAVRLMAAAKAILDRGRNPEQETYFPYLEGYVAFYAGDYSGTLAALKNASQTDPFTQCLIGQAYEHLGDTANAIAWYRQAASAMAHSVPAAFARPFAAGRLKTIAAH